MNGIGALTSQRDQRNTTNHLQKGSMGIMNFLTPLKPQIASQRSNTLVSGPPATGQAEYW